MDPSKMGLLPVTLLITLVEKEDDVETTFVQIKESYNLKSAQKWAGEICQRSPLNWSWSDRKLI